MIGLRLPANERLQFLAGQYIDFLLKDGKRRSFSIANAPHADERPRSSCTCATRRAASSPTTCSAR